MEILIQRPRVDAKFAYRSCTIGCSAHCYLPLMENRPLGRSELRIPPIVFGAMARRQQSDVERVAVLRTAIDSGLTTIDTAPLYDFGRAERQIALALEGRASDQVQVFTKVGLRWDGGDHGDVLFEFTNENGQRGTVRKNARPESVRWEVEQSLRRLGLQTLDLVQVHQPDLHTPIDDTMGALLDLRAEGKLRYIGVSNFSADQVVAAQRALGDVPLVSLQPEYSLLRRGIESELLPLCVERDIGLLCYSPLAGGGLSARNDQQLSPRIRAVIDQTLVPIAAHHKVSPAAVAVAWVINQQGISAAICGASLSTQIEEFVTAIELNLSAAEIERLSTEFARVPLEHSWEKTDGLARRARRFVGRTWRSVFDSRHSK